MGPCRACLEPVRRSISCTVSTSQWQEQTSKQATRVNQLWSEPEGANDESQPLGDADEGFITSPPYSMTWRSGADLAPRIHPGADLATRSTKFQASPLPCSLESLVSSANDSAADRTFRSRFGTCTAELLRLLLNELADQAAHAWRNVSIFHSASWHKGSSCRRAFVFALVLELL